MSSFKVQLREIPCHRTFELGPEFVNSAVSGLPIRAALERPADDPDVGSAVVDADLYIEDDNVFMRGSMRGHVVVACGRCVGPVEVPLDESLMVTFLPKDQVPELDTDEDEDDIPAADDLDVYPYEGEEVDLEPLFREQIILSVPFAPLCKEDCQGLCPSCGADLNTTTCNCERQVIDPRWSALEKLKSS